MSAQQRSFLFGVTPAGPQRRNLVIEALLDTLPIPECASVGDYLRSAIEDLQQAHRAESAADVSHGRLVRGGKIELSGFDQDRRMLEWVASRRDDVTAGLALERGDLFGQVATGDPRTGPFGWRIRPWGCCSSAQHRRWSRSASTRPSPRR